MKAKSSVRWRPDKQGPGCARDHVVCQGLDPPETWASGSDSLGLIADLVRPRTRCDSTHD